MNTERKKISAQSDPNRHWSYRMISALCGVFLGICLGCVGVVVTGIDSVFLTGLVIGTSTIVCAAVAYRFPYVAHVLRLLAEWLT